MLSKKKTQLPENSRGVLVFDVSELFMLSDFSIESALYGDLVVRLTAPSTPGGPIGEPTLFRNGRGFFGKSSRVSAVVFHTRQLDQGKLENRWRAFPTNRANDDTIQLEEAELSLFGDLEDRKNLSAENLIETLSPSSEDALEN
jgi:subtilisin-like proprotein convertase family protein